jgi:hypothetical protein
MLDFNAITSVDRHHITHRKLRESSGWSFAIFLSQV